MKIKISNREVSTKALLDTGASVYFMDKEFGTQDYLVLVKK